MDNKLEELESFLILEGFQLFELNKNFFICKINKSFVLWTIEEILLSEKFSKDFKKTIIYYIDLFDQDKTL